MAQSLSPLPLIVIVGQTATGKSALALQLAKKFNGEIICADSRTIYKGMDIGTAKPSTQDRQIIPHHLLDIVEPDEPFTAADFKHAAYRAIADIGERGRLPIMVGGSGLYIDAVLFDYDFRPPADLAERAQLTALSVEELQDLIHARGLELPNNASNPRHLVRVLESSGLPPKNQLLRENTYIAGIDLPKDELVKRIEQRTEAMFTAGLEREARGLLARYGEQCAPLQTIGYQEFVPYIAGDTDLAAVQQAIVLHTKQYAKRQKTWFKRNKSIHWAKQQMEIVDNVTTFLNKNPMLQ